MEVSEARINQIDVTKLEIKPGQVLVVNIQIPAEYDLPPMQLKKVQTAYAEAFRSALDQLGFTKEQVPILVSTFPVTVAVIDLPAPVLLSGSQEPISHGTCAVDGCEAYAYRLGDGTFLCNPHAASLTEAMEAQRELEQEQEQTSQEQARASQEQEQASQEQASQEQEVEVVAPARDEAPNPNKETLNE